VLKSLVITAVIVLVAWLLYRRFGGSRVGRERSGPPRMITTDDGATRAEIDGDQFDIDPAVMADVRALATDGNKIEAIKRLREATGLDLAEAKRIVDALEDLNA
jgi:hypothetical protein